MHDLHPAQKASIFDFEGLHVCRLSSGLYPTDLFSLAGPARSARLPLI